MELFCRFVYSMFIVYLSYIYPIFIVYLLYIKGMVRVGFVVGEFFCLWIFVEESCMWCCVCGFFFVILRAENYKH